MTVHHEVSGPQDAPVVVLSNSLGTDLTMWDEQVPELSKHFRVLRYDQRGHGGTGPGKPGPYTLEQLGGDVLELLDGLGLHRVHFAGVSLGGMTGMWLAEKAPERIDRLALLCTSAQLTPPSKWTDRAALVRDQGTAAIVESSLATWFTPATAGRSDIIEKFGAMLRNSDDEGYAGCAESIATMDLLPRLGEITAPTMALAGADDPATPPGHAEQISSAVPGSRLEVVPGAAHLANVEQAGIVNRLLVEHFTGRHA